MKRNRLLALLLTLVVLTGAVFCTAGCRHKDKETSSDVTVSGQSVSKGTLADLLDGQKDEKTAKTKTTAAKETSSSADETTARKTTTKTATAANTTKTSKTTAGTTSSGLFQVSSDYKQNHEYCIAVNTAQNIVIVYKKGADGNFTVPFKAMTCSCGRSGHETPSGQYTTLAKQRWLYLIDGTYGQYCTKFKEHYWFHSVPYYTQDASDLEWPEYNKLGSNCSAGCVRLCVRDVKWLYDNVPLGTVVRVYSSSAAEPLAKPAPVRIDTSDSNEKRGWDPTDPDAANPYHS